MRITPAVLLFLLVPIVAAPGAENAVVVCEQQKDGSTTKVPVYDKPSTPWVLDYLQCGQVVTFLGPDHGFAKVQYGNKSGYVPTENLRILPPSVTAPAALPANPAPSAPPTRVESPAVSLPPPASPVQTAPAYQMQLASPQPKLVLEDSTPVKIRIARNVSSADARTGEQVDFEVLEEVKVADLIVIPKGGVAWGTVTDAQPKRRMGRGGKLDITIDAVRLTSGEKAALRAVRELKGGGKTGAMTAGIVVTGLIVWPAAPFFLFMHGKDITIPKGTEITAYVSGDFNLDRSKFAPTAGASPSAYVASSPVLAQPSPTPPANQFAPSSGVSTQQAISGELALIDIKSSPEGADILVGGKFVGSTPSALRLPPGDHVIAIEKSGFTRWSRTVGLTPGGSITINAALQKVN
jgi:hypothetical protein